MAFENFKQIVSPIGKLQWVFVSGQGKQNYNKDGYDYTADVIVPYEKAKPSIDIIQAFYDSAPIQQSPKTLGYYGIYSASEDFNGANIETDLHKISECELVGFKFSTATVSRKGKKKVITIKDSKRNSITLKEGIGNGSEGRASGSMGFWEKGRNSGVKLYLNAIQVTRYIPYSHDDGFDDTEGYEMEDTEGFSDEIPDDQALAERDDQEKEEEQLNL